MYILSACRRLRGRSIVNEKFLRLSGGIFVFALLAVAVSLYVSTLYSEERQRLAESGDIEGAIQSVEMAARLDPFSTQPLLSKAYMLRDQGQNQEAELVMQAAADREPESYEVPQEIGDLRLQSMNAPRKAAESYGRALELNPRSDSALVGLAEAQLAAGELDEAKRSYERLNESGDITVDQLYDLGRMYVRTGEPEKGLQTLRKAQRQAENGLQGLPEELRQSQLGFLRSVELAMADALVVQRRYAQARQMLANSSAEQAPTIISLIASDPESYRQTVIDSDV
jgi:tetratricopeptide (TPR) repeat protein